MKKLLFLIIAMAFIACSATREINRPNSDKEIASQFKIKKIKKIKEKTYYIIYANRNDSTFKIIGNITDTTVTCEEKIRVGKSYRLDLTKYYPLDSLFGIPEMLNLGIRYANGISVEEKCHNTIYRAKNLNGLYIENKSIKR